MAKKIYDSPNVYMTEKDLTFAVETLGITTLGAVGETKKGPAFQPIAIANYDEFKIVFGGTSPEKFKNTQIVKYELPYIAKSYLSQSNQLLVTRILGLSGYNAGTAYAIRTMGACDGDTLTGITSGTTIVKFTVDTSENIFYVSGTTDLLIDEIASITSVDVTKFDTTYGQFFSANTSTYSTKNWYLNNVLYWGIFSNTGLGDVDTQRNTKSLSPGAPADPSNIDSYELPVGVPSSDRTSNILLNEFNFNETTDKFTGYAWALYAYDITGTTGTTISGKIAITNITQTCTPKAEYHKKLVATLRSRGSYITDNLNYNVAYSSVALTNMNAAEANPLASFDITGTTSGGTDFSYTVSLDKTKKNYIKNVLGSATFDKNANLFVEEVYNSTINRGWHLGYIKGLMAEILPVTNWAHYKFQFQSPVTPFFVSELRGGVPQRLFRFVSISDGNNANIEIKASVANVDLDKATFDLYIRAYNDSDKSVVLLERYLTLSMDETNKNYIGRKIGTINNKYPLKSAYFIVEMAENAPADAIPAGFEGYEFRTSGVTGITDPSYCGVPEIGYKVKYYKPGDLMVDPPDGLPIYSNGDKVRKAYLGFSDLEYGYDSDLLYFHGKQSLDDSYTYNDGADWATKTKGFHMDYYSKDIVDAFGERVFEYGVSGFTDAAAIAADPDHPYYDIKTRKFTALFYGGFDGWDAYRDIRTNVDDYKIGRTSFVRSGFSTFASQEYGETFGTSDYYAFLYGIKTFQNPEQTVINVLVTPGIDLVNNTELVRDAIEIVEDKRMDCIYIPTLPDIKLFNNSDASSTENWYFPNDIVNELANTEIDSNYTAVYYPWVQISDTENNANLFIPPTGEVVKNIAYTDNVAQPWYATAGYNRGIMNCIRARIVLDQDARDSLYPGRVNPIATFSDVGNLIWGNRNLQIADSAMNRLNIRRLLNQAKKLIMSVSKRLLFDPNDTTLRNQFLSQVNPILDNIRKERGLTDFRVKLDTQTEDDDRNTMRGKIFLKPVDALEFIELEFNVTPTSVSFDTL